jgi:hypothetical protein
MLFWLISPKPKVKFKPNQIAPTYIYMGKLMQDIVGADVNSILSYLYSALLDLTKLTRKLTKLRKGSMRGKPPHEGEKGGERERANQKAHLEKTLWETMIHQGEEASLFI